MSKRFRSLLPVLLLAGQVPAQHAATIEDTLAGITVGKSTLADVQRKFGPRLIVDQGRRAVRWNGGYEIFRLRNRISSSSERLRGEYSTAEPRKWIGQEFPLQQAGNRARAKTLRLSGAGSRALWTDEAIPKKKGLRAHIQQRPGLSEREQKRSRSLLLRSRMVPRLDWTPRH